MKKCKKCGARMHGKVCPGCAKAYGISTAERFVSVSDEIDRDDLVVRSRIEGGDNLAARKPYEFLGEQLVDVARAVTDKPGSALAREKLVTMQRAISGMSATVPSDGGFMISPTFSMELIESAYSESNVAALCKNIPISGPSDGLEAPLYDETSRATGSRWGGVQVFRRGEAVEADKSKPKIGMWQARLFDLKGLCYATETLLQDATALDVVIKKAFGGEFGFRLDDEIINGTGVGQCAGIINAQCLITIPKETGQTTGTIWTENINRMFSALFVSSRRNAVWFYNVDCEKQFEELTLAIGGSGVRMPLFMPAGMGNNSTDTARLKGLPAIPIEQCSALGTFGDIILADCSNYILIHRDMDTQTSLHVKFIEGEMVYRFTYPVNGSPRLHSTVSPYRGSTLRSHFVALQSR